MLKSLTIYSLFSAFVKEVCFPAVVPNGRVNRQGTAGKHVERQCETEESLGSGILVQAENLFVPHRSLAQNTLLMTELDTC